MRIEETGREVVHTFVISLNSSELEALGRDLNTGTLARHLINQLFAAKQNSPANNKAQQLNAIERPRPELRTPAPPRSGGL